MTSVDFERAVEHEKAREIQFGFDLGPVPLPHRADVNICRQFAETERENAMALRHVMLERRVVVLRPIDEQLAQGLWRPFDQRTKAAGLRVRRAEIDGNYRAHASQA